MSILEILKENVNSLYVKYIKGDEIVEEPLGGAHRNPQKTFENLRLVLDKNLKDLCSQDYEKLKLQRTDKFLKIGEQFVVANKSI